MEEGEDSFQAPDIRSWPRTSAPGYLPRSQGSTTEATGPGHLALHPGNPPPIPDIRTSYRGSTEACPDIPDIRLRPRTSGPSCRPGHPASARTSGPALPEEIQDGASPARTSDPSQTPGHPTRCPDIRPPLSVNSVRAVARVPLHPLDYIYSSSVLFLGLALI